MKPRKPIRRVSVKRAKDLVLYRKEKAKWLERYNHCERCGSGDNIDIHHIRGRSGVLLYDKTFFASLCRNCHNWVHKNPKEAMELGLLPPVGKWNNNL